MKFMKTTNPRDIKAILFPVVLTSGLLPPTDEAGLKQAGMPDPDWRSRRGHPSTGMMPKTVLDDVEPRTWTPPHAALYV